LGEREILRAVYVAVRDENWFTIPGVLSNLDLQTGSDSFELRFDSAHKQGDIDFRWQADVSGRPDGSIVWRMKGEAFTSFHKNRIGICVLHPIAECAGARCLITHSDGRREESRFPSTVAPHQPFLDIREMLFPIGPDIEASLAFAGDVFETEDQRNWTDASFKTYSTPLSLPFPARIEQGTTLAQSASLKLRGAIPNHVGVAHRGSTVKLTLQLDAQAQLPQIGLKDAGPSYSVSEAAALRLKSLHLDHLSIDLHPGDKVSEESFWKSAAQAKRMSLPLEVALASEADEASVQRFLREIIGSKVETCRWLANVEMQHPDRESYLRELQSVAPVSLGAGTNFAELNRNRPSSTWEGGVWFSLNPQMHATDNATLIDNLAAQSSVLGSIRACMGSVPVTVSPVSLKRRFARSDRAEKLPEESGPLPLDVDPRQMSLLGAGWTLGSLKHLAEGGAASVTYYETVGWRGVMTAQTGLPIAFGRQPESDFVYPLYHVFADLAGYKNAQVVRIESSSPLRADAIALMKPDRLRVMVANFSAGEVTIDLDLAGLASRTQFWRLDEGNVESAMRNPELYRQQGGSPLPVRRGVVHFGLQPFGLATIDALPSSAPAGSDSSFSGR
jgi:hypothetical protein